MEQTNREIALAVGLMRMALALLDREGERLAATRLQHAIDTTLKTRPLEPGEEIEPDQACLIAGIPLGPIADSLRVARSTGGRRRDRA